MDFQQRLVSESQVSSAFRSDPLTESLIGFGHVKSPSPWARFQKWRINSTLVLVGWRWGVKLGVFLTTAVLVINLGVTLGIVLPHDGANKDGNVVLMNDNCDRVKKYNTGYHLAINILSTLLLGSSNYVMQCLSAPTRSDVNKAHIKGIWLDVGISSLKNLKHISRGKLVLWIFLAASSWPLHLFFNSAVFVTLYAHSYDIYSVKGDGFSRPNSLDHYDSSQLLRLNGFINITDIHAKAVNDSLVRLTTPDCIEEFGQPFQSENNLLILVLDSIAGKTSENVSIDKTETALPPQNVPSFYECPADTDSLAWLCRTVRKDRCNTFCKSMVPELKSNSTWAPFGEKVDYCLVNRAEQQCTLNFSLPIMIIVIVMNACKAIMLCVVGISLTVNPLLTLGDAIDSFLTDPDVSIRPSNLRIDTDLSRPQLLRYIAISRRKWVACISVCLIATCFVGAWFFGALSATTNAKNTWGLGFGAADPRTLIYSWEIPSAGLWGIIGNALIANLAQPILSMVYFTYNGFLTAMISASEWDKFALFRKGLRVSGIPRGEQRVTHFLQLPYRYSIPLMGFSTLLHWLISQSIFVVSVITDTNRNPQGDYNMGPEWITCGYSLTPMLVVFLLGFILIGYAVFIGRGSLQSNIPISLSNSKRIATECHPEPYREGEAARKLQWGPRRNALDGSIQYAFSSAPVDQELVSDIVAAPKLRHLKGRFRMPFTSYDSVKNEEIELRSNR